MKYELIVAVCSRNEARIFHSDTLATSLHRLDILHNPKGRLQEHALVTDKAGASASSSHRGHNTLESEHTAVDQESDHFAAEIAAYLNRARQESRCEKMLIAADAKLTGRLRAHLDKDTAAMVRDFVIRDLTKIPDNELRSHLR